MTYINLEARVVYCGTLYVGTSSLKAPSSGTTIFSETLQSYLPESDGSCGLWVQSLPFWLPFLSAERGPSTGQMTHPLLWLPTYRRRRVKDWHRTSKALQNLVFVHMHVVPVYIMYVISKQDVIALKIQGSQGRTNSALE